MYKKNSGCIYNYIVNPNKITRKKYFPKRAVKKDPIYNKAILNRWLVNNNIPTTTLIGKIENGIFYDNENPYKIKNKSYLKKIFDIILEAYPSIFVKKADTGNGKDIFKIEGSAKDCINNIDPESNYVIEETINQHKVLSAINPYCVNTLKVVTYRKGNNIHFPNSYLRMGVGKAYLDNVKLGGIFIKYDIHSNKLGKVAYTYFKYGGNSFYKHPDTHYVFENRSLIFSKKIMQILTKAALMHDGPLIGWDIAYSMNGPIILEASLNPSLRKSQITSKGLLSNPFYDKILNGA
jgi:hypothetical protein